MRMKDQLIRLATIWATVSSRSVARLATIVVADGKFFDRIGARGKDLQTETFEKFLSFFRDGANWPDGRIPQTAVDLLDNFANIACAPALSSDNAAQNIAAPHISESAAPIGSHVAEAQAGAGADPIDPARPASTPAPTATGQAAA